MSEKNVWRTVRKQLLLAAAAVLIMVIYIAVTKWPFSPIVVAFMLGLYGAFNALTTSGETWRRLYETGHGLIASGIGMLSMPYWSWWADNADDSVSNEFFEVSSQILPVLVLAAVVDARRSTKTQAINLLFPILIVALSELAALLQVGFSDADSDLRSDAFGVVCGGYVTAVVALIFAIMADSPSSSSGPSGRWELWDRKRTKRHDKP